MFGPRLRIPLHNGLSESGDFVTLRPVEADEIEVFIGNGGGFQSLEVTGLLTGFRSNTLGDFRKWHEEVSGSDNFHWGVEHTTPNESTLIGLTSLRREQPLAFPTAETGLVLFNPNYWGMGAASAVHLARIVFAFDELGLFALRTSAFHSNTASRKAMENAGFTQTGIERNLRLFHGQYQHSIAYELPNPEQKSWDMWWGDDDVPDEFAISRAKSTMALEIGRERICW